MSNLGIEEKAQAVVVQEFINFFYRVPSRCSIQSRCLLILYFCAQSDCHNWKDLGVGELPNKHTNFVVPRRGMARDIREGWTLVPRHNQLGEVPESCCRSDYG